ncbi:FAD-dependent oxidoreductase [Levilactobacillus tujiorum]|uniref:FAD-dependent oxidoreductase n=1 Tax=Levilactobacillus tujiorum TaxID=2912243 RepID=UPI0014569F94|nr:FAD-dependent oxidoreductase [Levilactobacillus tujiorum]NLR31633.1 NAD(P)/FAD-dependent oxidoreductase [Levilactobacillus tujiorum]
MIQYDVVFVGNSHATWSAAVTLRRAGKSVAMLSSATYQSQLEDELLPTTPAQSWSAFQSHKQQLSRDLTTKMTTLFEHHDIQFIQGTGILMGPHMLRIGHQVITAKQIILNTGQHATLPKVTGQEFLHSRHDLLNLDQLPDHLTIIGAGPRALELASLANQFGTRVTILTQANRAAQSLDPRYVTKLLVTLQNRGIDVRFRETVTCIEPNANAYRVSTNSGLTIATDYVLAETSYRPNVDLMGLENAGIHTNAHGIIVDDHLRANGQNVFACGTVTVQSMIDSPATTTFEATYIAEQILGNSVAISYPVTPHILFTQPRIARVGISAAQAAGDLNYHTVRIPYGQQLNLPDQADQAAEMTVVLNQENQLVGADIYGMAAPSLVNTMALMINQRLGTTDLTTMIFTLPTPIQNIVALLTPALTAPTTTLASSVAM